MLVIITTLGATTYTFSLCNILSKPVNREAQTLAKLCAQWLGAYDAGMFPDDNAMKYLPGGAGIPRMRIRYQVRIL